ncbi:CFI-box-CTERM domain-containing protein [Paracoccus litorisediminis]|uniref:CFI-box-CTERM domain-containing protein n=1 Tax=Paracoccus litorisediminis TaxID=2006130 RepID=UPI00372E6EC5
MDIHSQSATGDINAVSIATNYITMVKIDGGTYMVDGQGRLFHEDDPDNVVKDGAGHNLTLDQAKASGAEVSDTFSDLSWRSPFGVSLQYPGGTENFLDGLREASPEVNTIRLDFNAATLENSAWLGKFHDFCQEAADRGYQLIIQYSDGQMSGYQTGESEGAAGKTDDPSGRMGEIGSEWGRVMDWFEQPENAGILDAVYGWEIVNEPMAYAQTAAGGAAYSHDVVSILEDHDIDWHGKNILVGGLGASANFQHLDLDYIREHVGDDLIWSWHMYPGWGNSSALDYAGERLEDQLASRIGDILGDNILLTETNIEGRDYDGDGLPDMLDPFSNNESTSSYNWTHGAEWLAENGIGMGYWPPGGRGSSYILNAGGGRLDINLGVAAHANNIWSLDEQGDTTQEQGQLIQATPSGPLFVDPFGQAYGYGGNDTITGQEGMENMLYGGDGRDLIRGAGETDFIFGQQGDDRLEGLGGNDYLMGGDGSDSLFGGAGNDYLEGGDGRDLIDGGPGNDILIGSGGDELRAGSGADRVIISGTEPEHGPVYISQWDRDDRIDLGNWEEQDRLQVRVETVMIPGQDPGIYITIPGMPEFSIVMTGEAAQEFMGVESFSGTEHGLEIDDRDEALQAAEWSYDRETGDLTDITEDDGGEDPPDGPGVDPNDPDDEGDDDDEDDPADEVSVSGGSCFVATAAYGHRMHPDVVALRHFRDHHLIRNRAGRAFIRFYWIAGPRLARHVSPGDRRAKIIRGMLTRFTLLLDHFGLSGRRSTASCAKRNFSHLHSDHLPQE